MDRAFAELAVAGNVEDVKPIVKAYGFLLVAAASDPTITVFPDTTMMVDAAGRRQAVLSWGRTGSPPRMLVVTCSNGMLVLTDDGVEESCKPDDLGWQWARSVLAPSL